jgi:hypothetical protein
LKIKAIILSLVFVFGGSGISLSFAQCCNRLVGATISIGNTQENHTEKDCCKCVIVKKNKTCCDDVVISTPINSSLYHQVENKKQGQILKVDFVKSNQIEFTNSIFVYASAYSLNNEALSRVPILIQKRVLQI